MARRGDQRHYLCTQHCVSDISDCPRVSVGDGSKCGAEIQKTINWVLFVLPPCVTSKTMKSGWLVGIKAHHIKPGRQQRRVTSDGGEELVPANLWGRPEVFANTGKSSKGVALPSALPIPHHSLSVQSSPPLFLPLTEYFHIPRLWKHS